MEAKERIRTILDYYGISVGDFARRIGVKTQQAVYDLLSGKTRSVSPAMCSKIASGFPELNKGWLLSGEGEMLADSSKVAAHQDVPERESGRFGVPVRSDRSDVGLPLVPIDAMAGTPGEDSPGVTFEECERYIVPEFQRLGAECLVRVAGASMQPRFYNGDLLAIRKLTSATFLQWGKVYVLDTEQGMLVKKLMPCQGREDCVLCVSDNAEEFPPFRIPKEEIRSLSIVLGSLHVE